MQADLENESVLFLHSTGTGPLLWATVPNEAIGPRRKLFPANLGYPPNPLLARGTTVTVADDVREVLRALPRDDSRVHVVAHSYGATVGLHVIEQLGPRAASAFLFEPVVFGALAKDVASDPAARAEARMFAEHPSFVYDAELGGRAAWLEMFVDYWNRPGAWSSMPAVMHEQLIAVGWKMFQEVRACFCEDRPFDDWKLAVRCTLATGELSPPAPRAMARALARSRENVTLVEVRDVGHMAPLVQPLVVYEELARHFARL